MSLISSVVAIAIAALSLGVGGFSSRNSTTADLSVPFLTSALDHWHRGPIRVVFTFESEDSAAAFGAQVLGWLPGFSHFWSVVTDDDNGEDERRLNSSFAVEEDEMNRVVILILLSVERGKRSFVEEARRGALKNGIWILPESLMDPKEIRSRFDSDIYAYSLKPTWVEVHEVFSVKDSHRFVNQFANWTAEGGLEVWESHVWERRQGFLRGVKLRNVFLPWSPWTYAEEAGGEVRCHGVIADGLKMLQGISGFELEHYLSPDGNWGAPNDPSDLQSGWNGMVKEVMEGRADFSQAPFATTLERSAVITYGLQYDEDFFTFVINKPSGASINFWVFVEIFSVSVWTSIFLTVTFGSVLLYISTNKFRRRPHSSDKMLSSLGTVSAAFLQRDSTMSREAPSTKLTNLALCLCGFALYAFYSGVLTSLMTATPISVDIESFKDVLNKGYQTLVLGDSADFLIMKNAKPGSVLHRIYHEVINDYGAHLRVRSIKQNTFQTMEGKDWVHLSSREELMKTAQKDPKYVVFSAQSATFGEKDLLALNLKEAIADSMSPMYPKDSELTGLFNHHWKKLEESGMLHKLKQKWFNAEEEPVTAAGAIAGANTLGYDQLMCPVLIVATGAAVSVILLVLEAGAKTWKERKIKKNNNNFRTRIKSILYDVP